MKFPWIKKFFGGEEEEQQVKEQEKSGMNRRHFLFTLPPAVIALPEIIKNIPTPDMLHISEVGRWPVEDAMLRAPMHLSGGIYHFGSDPGIDYHDFSTLTVRRSNGEIISLYDCETQPTEAARKALLQEARSLRALTHPNEYFKKE